MDKTPIKINFQPSIAVREPFRVEIDTEQTLSFKVPDQVRVSFNNFVLVWEESDESDIMLEEVPTFSDPPVATEYTKVDGTIELSTEFRDELLEGTASFRFDHSNGSSMRLSQAVGEYFMILHSPGTEGRVGLEQSLPQKATYLIPADGKVELELVPTTDKYPITRYFVEYFHKDDPINPISTQYWLVPPALDSKTVKLTTPSPPNVPINLPNTFYRINNISISGYLPSELDWVVGWNDFQFLIDRSPQPGEQFSLTYDRAFTLDQVLDYEFGDPHARRWY